MPGTLCRMSARVRWPYFFTSSDVTIVTEDGASVVFCLYLEAASTTGISILVSSSRLISVGSAGGVAADFCPSAASPVDSAVPSASAPKKDRKNPRTARRWKSRNRFTAKVYHGPGGQLQAAFSAARRDFLQNFNTVGDRADDKAEAFHRAAGLARQTNHQRLFHDHGEVAREDGVPGD